MNKLVSKNMTIYQSLHFIRTYYQIIAKMTYQMPIKKSKKLINRKLTQFFTTFVFTRHWNYKDKSNFSLLEVEKLVKTTMIFS